LNNIIKRCDVFQPEQGRFGPLTVKVSEFLKQFMYENGRLVGYLSGPDAFRALGMSIQVSSTMPTTVVPEGSSGFGKATTAAKVGFFLEQHSNSLMVFAEAFFDGLENLGIEELKGLRN